MSDIERADVERLLPDTTEVIDGKLAIGGCSVGDLAKEYGTPLYIYDEATLRNCARSVLREFCPLGARVSYAAKACAITAVLKVFREERLHVDVVSEGEMEAASRAGFTGADIHLHGNAKSDRELELAIQLGLHAIVVDNVEELNRLASLVAPLSVPVRIMLRLRLPIEAETHPHLRTAGETSKFGLADSDLRHVAQSLLRTPLLEMIGVHAHIGSQIADPEVYDRAARQLLNLSEQLRLAGLRVEEISIGGGWAVPYTPGAPSLSSDLVARTVADSLGKLNWARPAVEPGRALVARSSVAVYSVRSVKRAGAGRIVAIDGGFGDNPRPALYGARYTAIPADEPYRPPSGLATLVGRYCESGDVVVHDMHLSEVSRGDLVCIPMSGAYQLSMAGPYNLVPPPAAVMVNSGQARLIQRRATVADLLSRDL